MREKARYSVGLGWTYRFKSGEAWVLLPLDRVEGFEFGDKPEGRPESKPERREERSSRPVPPSAASYVTPSGELV
jgi:hypothetical protein